MPDFDPQTVLFTLFPRSVTLGPGPLPVSVMVSPRLRGSSMLGDYPDWLLWTQRLKDGGLTLVIRCGNKQRRFTIDTSVLRPDLWEALFNKETFVRSYEYADYSDRGIISYPVREALSALKSMYQTAAVELALPDDSGEEVNRGKLADMLRELAVPWNGDAAQQYRATVRQLNRSGRRSHLRTAAMLDSEGLIPGPPGATAAQAALPFAVFHHMPTPKQSEVPLELNTEEVLDFHQALSSFNSYPPLLRALGLVFDLELPTGFVPGTMPGKYGTMAVVETSFDWQTKTTTSGPETAYVNITVGQNHLFLTAPLVLEDPGVPFTAVGLMDLDPAAFGLAQVDVDGGLHKNMILAGTMNNADPERNLDPGAGPESAPHPEIYDRDATLPSLRAGGISLYADRRGQQLLENMLQSKAFNDALESGGQQKRPFFAEDLLRGYRIDVWDSHTAAWHSLHRRTGVYTVGDLSFKPGEEEGFVQTAAMQPAPQAAEGPDGEDLYVHEVITRWSGWSLSVPTPGKHVSRYGDPDKAVPPDDDPTGEYAEDEPVTPFKMTVEYEIAEGSLPRLVFGRRYRLRARVVDLAGNSLDFDDDLATLLALSMALPRGQDGQPYLRYEPVIAPLIVIRDPAAVTGQGSALDRLVICTYNAGIEQDGVAADTTAADRHLVPPRTSVEMGERLGMFDDAAGKLMGDPATWQLIVDRDAGDLNRQVITVAGQPVEHMLEPGEAIDVLPYLPDPLAAGAALRDLPGAPSHTLARIGPGAGGPAGIDYKPLSDPNPRPGSATLISFDGGDGWQNRVGLRLKLAEPAAGQDDLRPNWDPAKRVLTVYLPKGETAIVPLSSYLLPADLKLMGQWEWLRQYIELITILDPQSPYLQPGQAVDRVNHILQRAVEGGHWLLNPPLLLTLVHAVQQPLGEPRFTALNLDHDDDIGVSDPLHTAAVLGRADPAELAPITAWRRPDATDAYLMGALQVHGASSDKIDLRAEWSEPVDDPTQPTWQTVERAANVDTLPLTSLGEGYLDAPGIESRRVGYYDPENDQIAFVRFGDRGGPLDELSGNFFVDAAPRHVFNDTKHRRVSYTAVAASRFREYFPGDEEQEEAGLEPLDFIRRSAPVVVDVPASARPLAPNVVYVLPTFGWQRQTETNVKRSVRFGGGLRVYLERPWFSSGEGELLGVALWDYSNGPLDAARRDKFKAYFTQWGMDPIWRSDNLSGAPATYHFPDAVEIGSNISLEENAARLSEEVPGQVNVAGFAVHYEPERQLWFADLTIETGSDTYMPFVRLALVRFQPHALVDARISRVVLADFAQLTPDRSVLITVDPHAPRQLRVVVSGAAPTGPAALVLGEPSPPQTAPRPTRITVEVQFNDDQIVSDLAWQAVDDPQVAQAAALYDGVYPGQKDLEIWAGTVTFGPNRPPGRYRLLIKEYEYISSDYVLSDRDEVEQPGRLIFAETVELDEVLLPTS